MTTAVEMHGQRVGCEGCGSCTATLPALHTPLSPMSQFLQERQHSPFLSPGLTAEVAPSLPPTPRTKAGKGHEEEEGVSKHPHSAPW